MRIVVLVLGVLAVLIGLVFFGLAFLAPLSHNLAGTSAVQVYSEASYDALMAIASFVFAGLCASAAAYPSRSRLPQAVSTTTNR